MTIEYVIHHGDEIGEDLDFIDGKNWREAKKLIARCNSDNGIKADVCYIERRDNDTEECEVLWERINYRKAILKKRLNI